MLELFPGAPSAVETKGPEAGAGEPSCSEVWHMTQGQTLQQGSATQGAFPGYKGNSNFSTMLMPSWARASLCLPALVCVQAPGATAPILLGPCSEPFLLSRLSFLPACSQKLTVTPATTQHPLVL